MRRLGDTRGEKKKNRCTYVLLMASKISCASFGTPLPLVASFSSSLRTADSSRAFSAFRSRAAMVGMALSKPSGLPSSPGRILNSWMFGIETTWKLPGWLARLVDGFGGAGVVLMAMAFRTGSAAKMVPSSTWLARVVVILTLR